MTLGEYNKLCEELLPRFCNGCEHNTFFSNEMGRLGWGCRRHDGDIGACCEDILPYLQLQILMCRSIEDVVNFNIAMMQD